MKNKNLLLLGALCAGVMFFELLIFNQGYLINAAFNLHERRYSINDGSLYQFNLENGKLVAQGIDPNITFDNMNFPVASIAIDCTNSISNAIGQVFYRSNDEVFSETRSVRYNGSLREPTLLGLYFGFPKVVTSLRLDLTNISNDTISCSDFVVNPRVPFALKPARLIIYVGILLVFILYVFRNIQIKYKQEIFVFLFMEIFQLVVFKLAGVPINDQFVFLKIIIITSVSLCLSFTVAYVDFNGLAHFNVDSRQNSFSSPFLFLILIVFSYFPIITGQYLYHDDFLNYTGVYQNFFPVGVKIGRIGAALYIDLLCRITVENSFYGRSIAVIGILLMFLLFNKWMEDIGFGKKISLVVPFLCAVSLPFLNISAYLTEFTFIWAALFSCLSVVLFCKAADYLAAKSNFNFWVYFTVSLISILLALFTYQATSTVGLALLAAYMLSNKSGSVQILARTTTYYIYFGVVSILYLFLNKFIWKIYNIPAVSRAELISSISEVTEKVTWFFTVVLPQSIKQLLFIFGGKSVFTQEFSLGGLEYRNSLTGITLQVSLCAIAILGCVYFLQKFSGAQKSAWFIFLLSISIPYSYFFLLVTKESSYSTFYVSGLVSIMLVILGVCGSQILWHFVKSPQNMKQIFIFIIIPVVILVSFNNNRYLYTMWVRGNDFNYFYVKKFIQNSEETGRIHIFGSTEEVDQYWINAAKLALLELGKSPNSYNISYSDNEYLINLIGATKLDGLSQILTQDEMEFLRSNYVYNSSFFYYYLKSSDIGQENLERLRDIFQKVDLIPTQEDHALIIDMRKIK